MVKLCIITHSYPRFGEDWRSNFIESLARAYARNGADVTVFVPYTVKFNRPMKDEYGIKIVNYKYVPFGRLHTIGYGHSMKSDLHVNLQDLFLMPFLLLVGTIRFAALLRKEKFDIIQAHWAVPNTLIAVFGRYLAFSRAAILTSFPGSDVTVIKRMGLLGRLFLKIIAKSDYLSCNSADLREDLEGLGLEKGRVDFVIYGVDEKKICFSEEARRRVRGELGIPGDGLVLLMIGRFVPKKGFSTAFESLKLITEKMNNVTMVVVGDGPMRAEYDEILRRDGTGRYVRFVGEILPRELAGYYSACDIFLMPSCRLPSDGLNVVVPEAMACGRPIVATPVGGNDLVVFDGENGWLHEEHNARQLADCVGRLAADPAMRTRMGENSLRMIRERFNWDSIAQYCLARYRDSGRRDGRQADGEAY